ncbi:MAG: PQQ-binding-like beta-propeller repeat protein [Bacteroidales bacterium]|nr:PQQ-binding-like beta-propeller repeat protein [Bacteroidales bacterium]
MYVHFGAYGTACINTLNGIILWKQENLYCKHVQGPGSSPIIYKDLLILHMEGTDVQYLCALNKKTGEIVWKTERETKYYEHVEPINKKAYITPVVITIQGKDLLISNGAVYCAAYDPLTGKEIWKVVFGDDSTISMPLFANGLVIFNTGSVFPPEGNAFSKIFAVDPNGEGDITSTNIRWEVINEALQLGTPVSADGLLYIVNSKNIATCIDVETGKKHLERKIKRQIQCFSGLCKWVNLFSRNKG